MRTIPYFLLVLLTIRAGSTAANVPESMRKLHQEHKVHYRGVCAAAQSQIDQDINNVRAKLRGGGDCWWDLDKGHYIVPKVDPASGQPEVSSIFAGSVWLGGIDAGKNLKMACQTYSIDDKTDFWPGPIDFNTATADLTCTNWDRHFRVTSDEIRRHLANLANGDNDPAHIPPGVKGWPAKNNPYFMQVWGFELPNTNQALAGFNDVDGDGLYDPIKGDYPALEIRGCPMQRFPDEMIFWIYNDWGGGQPHGRTKAQPMFMEVQVQAFGFKSDDELNDCTFQRYKLINRSQQSLDSTFFGMWIDPDLGCSTDDYIGCDTSRNLAYVYNSDAQDGQPGTLCDGGVPTYGDHIPIIGFEFLHGALGAPDQNGIQRDLGMSVFMYYNRNSDIADWNGDPQSPAQYYNYLTGCWRDGTPLTQGGTGYNPGNPNAKRVHHCFPSAPNDATGWSMCSENLDNNDRRIIQASGPFTLNPGAVNELILGIPWVPDQHYPCPDLSALFHADAVVRQAFDGCLDLFPIDAPTANWIELDREVIGVLTNEPGSNNFGEKYRLPDIFAPQSMLQSMDSLTREQANYHFEGYLVYQLAGPDVKPDEFTDPDKSRLVYNFDVKNGVTKIYNWKTGRDPATNRIIYFPELEVSGTDSGIRHTFSIKEDKFATGNDKTLINHKKYYYAILSYAYNNFETFDPLKVPMSLGQQKPFMASRKSADGGPLKIYTVIPRPVTDRALQISYGDGVAITRLEGTGAGGNFLDITPETRAAMLDPAFDSTLTYKPGHAPINVTIFNPFEVQDGDYELVFTDRNPNDTKLDADARWQLRKLPDGIPIASEKTIAEINEQIVAQYGFSVSIAQTAEPGDLADNRNGAIGMQIEYANPDNPWLQGWPAGDLQPFVYVKTKNTQVDYDPDHDGMPLDPKQQLTSLGDPNAGPRGWFVPYVLANWRLKDQSNNPFDRMVSPAWQDEFANISSMQGKYSLNASYGDSTGEQTRRMKLAALPNVDLVLTADKSKWSRCVVLEGATPYYTDVNTYHTPAGLKPESPAGKKRQHFDVRYALSVGKDDNDGDGLPDPDGALNPANAPKGQGGKPLRGMGWFPGYAVDVETGQRLNVFFSENSCYAKDTLGDAALTGRDMMWNPTDEVANPAISKDV
jgi:hypothetical protein